MSLPDKQPGGVPSSGRPKRGQGVVLEDLYRLLVESVPDYAIFVLDPDGRVASWNAGAERIKGWLAEEVIGQHYRLFFPPDVRDTQPDYQLEVAAREGRYEVRDWRQRKDGSRFWAHVVLTALYDDGELVGYGKVTGDRTAERAAQQELARQERQLEEAQEIAHLGSWEYSRETGQARWSEELFRIFGLEPAATVEYNDFLARVHPDDQEEVERSLRRSLNDGMPYVHEHRIVRPDGAERWVQSRAERVTQEDGLVRLVGTTLDITELKEVEQQERRLAAELAARQEAERTAQRMGFLAEASALLNASLDLHDTLRTVAWLSIPSFADWCAVDMLDPHGQVERLAVAHLDPDQVDLVEEINTRYPPDPNAEQGVHSVLRTGEPQLYEDISEDLLERVARDATHRDMLLTLGLESALQVPIRVRDRAIGVITFVYAGSDRHYSQDDLVVAQELASRAGLAIENAQLHAAERDAREHAEQAREQITRLQSITAELSEAVTPDAVARVMVDQGAAAVGAASGALVLVREEGMLEMVRDVGLPEEVADRFARFHVDAKFPLAEAVRRNELVVVSDPADRDRRFPDLADLPPDAAARAMVAVPLRSATRVIGSLGFGYAAPRPFYDEDRRFLEALGRQCAQALERAWLYETEHTAREAAEAASRAKTQFVAMMSHELRTPLSAIIGYQELLSEQISGPVNEKQANQLRRIRAAALHLRDLINQILSLSRIEAGSEDVELEPLDLTSLVDDVVVMMSPEVESKGLTLELRMPDGVVELETDAAKVRQILINLLSNAVKFTPHGEITVVLEATETDVAVRVRDTGVGIAEEDRDRIFDVFTQVDQSMTRSVGGSGLGLAVSRRLARLLGGTLELDSRPGDGSTFTLRLPLG